MSGASTSITLSSGEVISVAGAESNSILSSYGGSVTHGWIIKPAKNAEITITAHGDCEIYGLL